MQRTAEPTQPRVVDALTTLRQVGWQGIQGPATQREYDEAVAAVKKLVDAAQRVVTETGSSGVGIPSIGATDQLRAALAAVQS